MVESRSVQRRRAAQRGEPAPVFGSRAYTEYIGRELARRMNHDKCRSQEGEHMCYQMEEIEKERDEARATIAVLTEVLREAKVAAGYLDGYEEVGDIVKEALANLPASVAEHIAREAARARDIANMDNYCHQKALVADTANALAQSRLDVLRAIEWVRDDEYDCYRCPSCTWWIASREDEAVHSHDADCALKAALPS